MRSIESTYRQIVEACADGVLAVDTEGCIVYANGRMSAMLGYGEGELLGRTFREIVSEETLDEAERGFARRRAGIRETYELGLRRADGTHLDVLVSSGPLFDAVGDFSGAVAMITDVTERVRVERALRESEERFRQLYERTPVMMHSIDRNGRLLSVSDLWCERLGYTRAEVVGRPSVDFLTPASRALARGTIIPEFFRTGVCRDVSYQFVCKDGTIRDILLSATAEFDTDGRVLRSLAVLTDVTEHNRAEAARRESEARFIMVARVAPVGIFRTDATGATIYVNERWCEMTGLSPEAARGDGWAQAVHPDDRARVIEAWARAVRAGVTSRDEYRVVHLNGAVTWVFGQAVPERGPHGELLGHVGTLTDITERKHGEEEMYRHRSELEALVDARTAELAAANRELETFAYSVSHDLRAPLRAIDGFGRLLCEDYGAALDARGRGYVERIRVATRRTTQIVEDLLRLSRVTRAELRRERVDVSAMAREVVAGLRQADPARSVEVRVADGLAVEADRELLRILLENLLGNAWKFTSKRAHAHIEVGADPDGTIHVRDDGAGFDMAHAGELFQPFRRLHGLDEFEGTGIGLATVARIVERHCGRVWAEGAVGQGATVYFRI